MKGKRGDHRPPEPPAVKQRKSKPHQQAPPIPEVAHNRRRKFAGSLTEQDTARLGREPEQQKLDIEAPPPQPTVVNNFISAKFLKPHPERDKDGKAFVGFEISFPLAEEHRDKKLLPARILEAWQIVSEHGYPSLSIDGIPAQVVVLAIAADALEKETALTLPFAEIENATISVVEETGQGEATKVSRLKFRAVVEIDSDNWRWARTNFQKVIWIKMSQAQGSLLEEEAA